MEKGDISEFGHLACPLAGGDMGAAWGLWGPEDKLIGRPGYRGGGDLVGLRGRIFFGLVADIFRGEADSRVGWRQFFEEL